MNEIQYLEELTSVSKNIEKKLEVVKENLITNFQNELNVILNSTVSDLEITVNQLNKNIKSNLSISNEINEFDFKIKNRLLLANNNLEIAKQKFDSEIKEKVYLETNKLKTFIDNNSKDIQQELQDALYQINKSENNAVTHLQETYDLGVETIVSAEKTSLANLKKLTLELSEKLNLAVEEVEKIISEKLENAFSVVKKLENDAISNLNKVAIRIQRDLENIKEDFFVEVQEVIKRFELTLDNYSSKLKEELKTYKNQLQDELILEKELVFIELDKEKNNIIEELNLLKHTIMNEINAVAKEVKDKIDAVKRDIENLTEQRYVTVLPANETTIQLPQTYMLNDRVKVYVDGILHLKEGFFTLDKANRIITLSESYSYPTNVAVIADLPDHNIEALKDQLYIDGEKYKQQVIKEIQNSGVQIKADIDNYVDAGKQQIQNKVDESVGSIVGEATQAVENFVNKLIEQKYVTILEKGQTVIELPKDFLISPRVRLFIDGEILIPDVHYTINSRLKKLTLLNPYQTKVNVIVIDDYPDENFEALKNQLYTEGTEFKDTTIAEIKRESSTGVTNIQNTANECINRIVTDSTNSIDQYMTNLKEQRFKYVLLANSNSIPLPPNYVIHHRTRVYIDGILAVEDEHYTIDYSTKSIKILQPLPYDRFVFITDEYPSTDLIELKKTLFAQLTAEKDLMIDTIKNQAIIEINKIIEKNIAMLEESKQEIHMFTENYKERNYSTVLSANQTAISISKDYFPLSMFAKVYFDGILQKIDINYTLNLETNTITLIEPFNYNIDVSIYDNIQTIKM